jgi:hypothetical protein
MVGWVVLSNSWVELTEDTLRARLDQLYSGQFLPPRERGTFVVGGPVAGMQFLINSAIAGASGMFMLHSVPGPYTEFSPFANHIRDAALRHIAITQQAWLGLDRMGVDKEDDAYCFIGKVLAELAPADAAALVHPGRLITLSFDGEVRRRLANGGRFD